MPKADATDEILTFLQEGASRIGSLEARIHNIETEVKKILKILTDGNGQPSILSQVTGLKINLDHIKEDVENHTARFEGLSLRETRELKESKEKEEDLNKTKKQGQIALIVAIIGALAATFQVWFSKH